MRTLPRLRCLLLGLFLLVAAPGTVCAAMQVVALFPPDAVGDSSVSNLPGGIGPILLEKLKDRFDVTLLESTEGGDGAERRRKARALGANYILTGTLARVGRTVTLDLTLMPTEGNTTGNTVVATAEDGDGTGKQATERDGAGIPFVYRRVAIEATAKLKQRFFGDGIVGRGGSQRKIPMPAGSISRSRSIPGDVVSIAHGDTDRNGKGEIVAAYRDSIVIYLPEGVDLVEKSRIAVSGDGMVHIDVADLNRNGIAEIVAVRYVAGKAFSDILEFDGKEYRRLAGDLPYFLRVVDLGPEGIVLVGQESDPASIFAGPIFRLAMDRYGSGEIPEVQSALPLPEGSWIYSFVPLRSGGEIRYAAIGDGNRLRMFDERGKKLWEGIDAVFWTETTLEAPVASGTAPSGQKLYRQIHLAGRLLSADLDGDKTDELVLANNIVRAGAFFENLKLYSNSELLCFAQAGDSLALAWRTAEVGSSTLDLFLDRTSGNGIFRIGIASPDEGKILGRFGEWRMLWVR